MSINKTAFFCHQCNVPILNNRCEKCHSISTTKIPLKASPVFQEELDMLSDVTEFPLNKLGSLNLWVANRYYYFKGAKIYKLVGGNMYEPPKIIWLKDEKRIFKEIDSFVSLEESVIRDTIKEANRFSLGTIEEKAFCFIRETKEDLKNKVVWTAVSFSGGKDSATVSHLVRKALGNYVIHIFSDTTIEHPSTIEYLDKYIDLEKIFFIAARSETDFMTMVKKAQMPSRIHRWCCSVLKTSPIENLLKKVLDRGEKVLTFDGVRHEESKRREGYSAVSYETKVSNNIIASPLIEWSTMEEWLYILSENILFNDAYRRGFKRIGCVVCPFSPEYPEFLIDYYSQYDTKLNSMWTSFREILIEDVKEREEISDPRQFLAEGKWKVRSGSFKKNNIVAIRGCLTFEDMFLDLSEPEFQKLKEYLKPLGRPFIEGNYIMLLNKDSIRAKFKYEDGSMTVVFYDSKAKSSILKQITKARLCSNCGLCQTKCPVDAILGNCASYTINMDKCIQCGKCVDISDEGCITATSLRATISLIDCQA